MKGKADVPQAEPPVGMMGLRRIGRTQDNGIS